MPPFLAQRRIGFVLAVGAGVTALFIVIAIAKVALQNFERNNLVHAVNDIGGRIVFVSSPYNFEEALVYLCANNLSFSLFEYDIPSYAAIAFTNNPIPTNGEIDMLVPNVEPSREVRLILLRWDSELNATSLEQLESLFPQADIFKAYGAYGEYADNPFELVAKGEGN